MISTRDSQQREIDLIIETIFTKRATNGNFFTYTFDQINQFLENNNLLMELLTKGYKRGFGSATFFTNIILNLLEVADKSILGKVLVAERDGITPFRKMLIIFPSESINKLLNLIIDKLTIEFIKNLDDESQISLLHASFINSDIQMFFKWTYKDLYLQMVNKYIIDIFKTNPVAIKNNYLLTMLEVNIFDTLIQTQNEKKRNLLHFAILSNDRQYILDIIEKASPDAVLAACKQKYTEDISVIQEHFLLQNPTIYRTLINKIGINNFYELLKDINKTNYKVSNEDRMRLDNIKFNIERLIQWVNRKLRLLIVDIIRYLNVIRSENLSRIDQNNISAIFLNLNGDNNIDKICESLVLGLYNIENEPFFAKELLQKTQDLHTNLARVYQQHLRKDIQVEITKFNSNILTPDKLRSKHLQKSIDEFRFKFTGNIISTLINKQDKSISESQLANKLSNLSQDKEGEVKLEGLLIYARKINHDLTNKSEIAKIGSNSNKSLSEIVKNALEGNLVDISTMYEFYKDKNEHGRALLFAAFSVAYGATGADSEVMSHFMIDFESKKFWDKGLHNVGHFLYECVADTDLTRTAHNLKMLKEKLEIKNPLILLLLALELAEGSITRTHEVTERINKSIKSIVNDLGITDKKEIQKYIVEIKMQVLRYKDQLNMLNTQDSNNNVNKQTPSPALTTSRKVTVVNTTDVAATMFPQVPDVIPVDNNMNQKDKDEATPATKKAALA